MSEFIYSDLCVAAPIFPGARSVEVVCVPTYERKQMRRYYELDVLDTLAVDAAAHVIVTHADATLAGRLPETKVQVLDRAIEGLRALSAKATEQHEASTPPTTEKGVLDEQKLRTHVQLPPHDMKPASAATTALVELAAWHDTDHMVSSVSRHHTHT